MAQNFNYTTGMAVKALALEEYHVWDCSVIKAKGKYHMFSSRMPKALGFRWLFDSEIIHCVSDTPQGPYHFQNVVFPRRGRGYFDGMDTHNTCIKEYNGKYYLYYMGTTYNGEIPKRQEDEIRYREFQLETWNRKRIGLAVADDIDGEFKRLDEPILLPRDCSKWDCTCTTNPTVAILPDGKTYMMYKSRSSVNSPLQLGVAVADAPDGKFERLTENPIFQFDDPNMFVEDPFLWYDSARKKFCILAKDDSRNGVYGITGEKGAGFYAESDDCIHFEIGDNPKVYTKHVKWADGTEDTLDKFERPSLIFDEKGVPTHLYCAGGIHGESYAFIGGSYVTCTSLQPTLKMSDKSQNMVYNKIES